MQFTRKWESKGNSIRENLIIIYSHSKALEHAKQAVNDCSFDLIRATESDLEQLDINEHNKKVRIRIFST